MIFSYSPIELIDSLEIKLPLEFNEPTNRQTLEDREVIYLVEYEWDSNRGYVKVSGGLEYANMAMTRYFEEALALLVDFPDSDYKASLEGLVRYTIERKK
jgi:octaprenyl-diphosphate synthase